MKLLWFIFLFVSNITLAQHSALYGTNRKLLADPAFQIDKNSFENSINIDLALLPKIYNKIKYPEIARENNQEGIVVVELSINSGSKDYRFKLVKSSNAIFTQPVLSFFTTLSESVKSQIAPEQGTLKIYIPVQFKILKNRFKGNLKKNKTVTIETGDISAEAVRVK